MLQVEIILTASDIKEWPTHLVTEYLSYLKMKSTLKTRTNTSNTHALVGYFITRALAQQWLSIPVPQFEVWRYVSRVTREYHSFSCHLMH